MKHLISLSLLLSLLSCSANQKKKERRPIHIKNYKETTFGPSIVLVGKKISLNIAKDFKPKKDTEYFGYPTDVKYKITELIHGKYQKNIIEFRSTNHYNNKQFSTNGYDLLLLTEINGKLSLEGFEAYKVYETMDGRFAHCGPPHINYTTKKSKKRLKNIDFKHKKDCTKGVSSHDVFETIWKARLIRRGTYSK